MLFRFPVFHKILQYWNIRGFRIARLSPPPSVPRSAPLIEHTELACTVRHELNWRAAMWGC